MMNTETQQPQQQEAEQSTPQKETTAKAGGKKRWTRHRKKLIIGGVALLVVVVGGKLLFSGGSSRERVETSYTTEPVVRQDVSSTITGSGTLEAANSYSVTALVDGEILTADFEEGQEVKDGDILYTIDSSDIDSSLEQAQLSLNQAQRNYETQQKTLEDLTIQTPISGQVISLSVEEGDEVTAGQTIGTVRDSSTMELTVKFASGDVENMYVGQGATVTLDSTFETLSGLVTKISGVDEVLSGNVLVQSVTIAVKNPGGLSITQSASATVGGLGSLESGTFAYKGEESLVASANGEVISVPVKEGEWVSKEQPIAILQSDSVENAVESAAESLRNAEISLENQQDRLEDYTITSPISGTIVDKNYLSGETAQSGQVLCTIYDLSYLTMTLNVDELDIASLAVGQKVSLTADAVEGKTYEGMVTKVSVAGSSTGSATTYPVTIRIDEPDGLLPGMSVDAEISLESASDVLVIPTAALNRGNTVLVTADSPSAANGTPYEIDGESEVLYYSVPVITGVSDDSFIEITSGLQEGDTVAYIDTSANSQNAMEMMMPSGMGDMSGGMSGGMGGGAPSGMGGAPGGR